MLAFAGVGEKDRKALSRYKKIGIKANLFHESDGYVVGERSIEYSLTGEARELFLGDLVETPLAAGISGATGQVSPVRGQRLCYEAG